MAFYQSLQDQAPPGFYDSAQRQAGFYGVYNAANQENAVKAQAMQWQAGKAAQSPAMQDLASQIEQMKAELAEAQQQSAKALQEASDIRKASEAEKAALLGENYALQAQLSDHNTAAETLAYEKSTLEAELQRLRAQTEATRVRGAQLEKSAALASELEERHQSALRTLCECLTSIDGVTALPQQATLEQVVEFACQSVRQLSSALSTSQGKFSDLIAKHSTHVLEHQDEALYLAYQRRFLEFMKQHAGLDELATIYAQWVVLTYRVEQLQRQVAEQTNAAQALKQENVLLQGQVDDSAAKVVELEYQNNASNEAIGYMKKHAHEQQQRMFALQSERDAVNFEVSNLKTNSKELNQQLSLAQLRISANDDAIKQFLLDNAQLTVDLEESQREISSLKTQLQSHARQYERVKSQADGLLAQKQAFLEEISHCGMDNLYTSDSDLKDIGEALARQVYTLSKLAEEAGFKSARCLALLDEQKKITSEFGLQNQQQKQELYEFYALLGEKYPFCSFARLLERLYMLQESEAHAQQCKEQLETRVSECQAEIQRFYLAAKQSAAETSALNERLRAGNDERAQLACQISDFEAQTQNLLQEMQEMKELIEEYRIAAYEAAKARERQGNELSAARSAIERMEAQHLEQQRLADITVESLKTREQEVANLSYYLTACRQREISLRGEKTDFIVKVNESFGLANIFGANDLLSDVAAVVADVLRDRPDDLPNLQRNYAQQVKVGQELTLELQRARSQVMALQELQDAVFETLGMQGCHGDIKSAIQRLRSLSAEKSETERQLYLAKEKQYEYLLATYKCDDSLQQLQQRYASADQQLVSLRAELESQTAASVDRMSRSELDRRTLMQQYEQLYEKTEALEEAQRRHAKSLQELEAISSKSYKQAATIDLQTYRLEATQRAYEQAERLKNEAVEQLTLARQQAKQLRDEKTQFMIDANAKFKLACVFDVDDLLSDVSEAVALEMQYRPALMTNLQRNYSEQQAVNRDLTERFYKASIELQLLRDFRTSAAKAVMPVAELDAPEGILQRIGELVRVEAQFLDGQKAAAALRLEIEQLRYHLKDKEGRCAELAASLAASESAAADALKKLSDAVCDKNADQALLQSYHEKTISLTQEAAALRADLYKQALAAVEAEQAKRAGLEAELQESKRQTAQLLQEKQYFIGEICASIGLDPAGNGNLTLPRIAQEITAITAVKAIGESVWQPSEADKRRSSAAHVSQPKGDFCLSPTPFPRAEKLKADFQALRGAAKLAGSALRTEGISALLGAVSAVFSQYYQAVGLQRSKITASPSTAELSAFKRQLFEQQKIVLAQLQQMGIFYCGGDTIYLIYFLMAQIAAGKRQFAPVPEVFAELRRLDSQNKELTSLVSVLEIKLRQRRDA